MRRPSVGLLSQAFRLQDMQRSNWFDIEILTAFSDAFAMILVLLTVLAVTSSGAWWSDTWQTAGQASQKVATDIDHNFLLVNLYRNHPRDSVQAQKEVL